MKVLKAGLERDLPPEAHLRVAGRLGVSLTRVADGENVLVSDFSSKEELIQVGYLGGRPPELNTVYCRHGGL